MEMATKMGAATRSRTNQNAPGSMTGVSLGPLPHTKMIIMMKIAMVTEASQTPAMAMPAPTDSSVVDLRSTFGAIVFQSVKVSKESCVLYHILSKK